MEEIQARSLIRQTFTKAFDKPRFLHFIKELLNRIDESKKTGLVKGQMIREAFRGTISSYERLGSYTDPNGEEIDILVISVATREMLERTRTRLRNFVGDYLQGKRGSGSSAVLAAFVPRNGEDWRFSFVKLEYDTATDQSGKVNLQNILTPARRYSFLVGSNEESHTAQRQFLDLLKNDQSDPQLSELEEAFDIEKVTKEFFVRYKGLFEDVRDGLNELLKKNKAVRADFEEKSIETEDFAKKLLGQIVFLYFLQKKGWFGVKRTDAWGTGDKHYLRHLFAQRERYYQRGDKQIQRNFFNDILEPLFYNTLATERTNDYSDRFDCKIPFLNGGLFEPMLGYDWVNTDILLPDKLFSNDEKTKDGDEGTGILDVFDRYNFTVNEAEPLEKDVAVDPEMLGKVFENLLPENLRHKGGTYYTPRVIVNYMCQQSLINYLSTHLTAVPRVDLETFIRIGYAQADFEAAGTHTHKDKFLPESVSSHAPRIDKLLEDIAVCDPAIGSGAFPVGMMQEIVRARQALAAVSGMPERSAYELKRHTIEHSLYGVDFDSSAIEIAKLRLWLSLVVDEEDRDRIKSLPNLDYKIMQGNSLLDEFMGVKLLDEDFIEQNADADAADLKAFREKIATLRTEAIEIRRQHGKSSAQAIKHEQKIDQMLKQIGLHMAQPEKQSEGLFVPESKQKLILLKQRINEYTNATSQETKKRLRSEIELFEWQFMEKTLMERKEHKALRELEKHRRDNRRAYFLWKLNFVEVFQAKGGFDVVMGNPPYLRLQGLQEAQPELVPRYRANYQSAKGNFDIYAMFIELGYKLLNPSGEFAYIAPHKFFQATFGKPLRDLLGKRRALRHVVRFGAEQVFENPTTYTCLLFLSAQPKSEFDLVDVTSLSQPDEVISAVASHQAHKAFERGVLLAPVGDNWDFVIGGKGAVLSKLQEQTVTLNDITRKIFVGLQTGADKVFVLRVLRETRTTMLCYSKATETEVEIEKDFVKPFLMGKDIHRYEPPRPTNVVIFPYRHANGGAKLMSQKLIRDNFPLGWKYLFENKSTLQAREGGRFQTEWYCFGRPQNITEFEAIKIMTPDICFLPQLTIDETRRLYHTTTIYSFVFKDDIKDARKYFLGVLNSKVLWFFLQATGNVLRGGYVRFKTEYLRPFPIPCSLSQNPPTEAQQQVVATLVDYVLFLKANISDTDSHDQRVVSYFEQLIDALVYELYLTDEIHEAGKHFFQPLIEESLPALEDIRGDKLSALRTIFERLFDRNHIIRENIFFLDTIKSVRMIEGKT